MTRSAVAPTDYLVVGAGLSGLGFVDSLLEVSDADVVMVDRRPGVGGHWQDAYPFLRLHQPSAAYGIGAVTLHEDRREAAGPDVGCYARASATEVLAHFETVLRDRLQASGRVRFLPRTEYGEDGSLRSLLTGETRSVEVRRAVVRADHVSSEVPEVNPPPFPVDPNVHLVTPRGLAALSDPPPQVVVLGAGKTSMDTICWLLDHDYAAEQITWIRPREPWLNNRRFLQPGALALQTVTGAVLLTEATAAASSVDDAFLRAEASRVVLRIDPGARPTVSRGATIGEGELSQLRRVQRVVRGEHVTAVSCKRIALTHGDLPLASGTVVVHCVARGVPSRPPRPVFEPDRITVQALTRASLSLSSAAIARVEAMAIDTTEKNRLCPPMERLELPADYLTVALQGLAVEAAWRSEPALRAWFDATRLNLTRTSGGAEVERADLHLRLRRALPTAYANLEQWTKITPASVSSPHARVGRFAVLAHHAPRPEAR